MEEVKKVVLAYSGGLDTTYCAVYLSRKLKMEVHALLVNTGGFAGEELHDIEEKAKLAGVHQFKIVDTEKTFYEKCIRYLIYGNILRNQTYPLSVSAERMFQALEIANYAKSIGASAIAHGSTGAGNDQVRFDIAFNVLCPEMDIITPIRDQQLSRQEEMAFLKANGIYLDWHKAAYSINKGIWGTSIGGKETLSSHLPLPAEAYPSQPKQSEPSQVTIEFKKGQPVGLDGQSLDPLSVIHGLNRLGEAYAIGRDIHVGDTIIGIKGRVAFEAPAAIMLIKAHQLLEKHTLTKWQAYWKNQLAEWYGMTLHEAGFLDPVMRNMEGFMENIQLNVSGKVLLTIHPYRFTLDGVESPHDLMKSSFGDYGEKNKAWTGDDVKGFTKIMSNATKIYRNVNLD